ncbi:MAG: hypothetical protein LBI87_01380 [Candidatus Accumulibacter sp.]|jgi:soluble cytochrome b562|nr:hypothetical protein [Accumulibacter sp.]
MFQKIMRVSFLLALLGAMPACQTLNVIDTVTGMADTEKSGKKSGMPAAAGVGGILVADFVVAQKLVLDAQISFAQAFNLNDQAKLLQAEKQALSSGSIDKTKLQKTQSVSENAQKAIEEKMAKKASMDSSSKGKYARGLVSLTGAMGMTKKLSNDAKDFASASGVGALTSLFSADAAVYVATGMPGYLVNLASATKSALSFGKMMDIKLPKNADSLL